MVNAKWVLATQTIISTGKVRGVTKNGVFTVRLTVRGGRGGSAPSALTFYLIVSGFKNAFFMPL